MSRPPMPLTPAEGEPRVVGVAVGGTAAPAAPEKRTHLVDHPAALHALTVLCNRQSSAYSVRASCNHLLVLLVLEAMRSLPTRPLKVETLREPWPGLALAKPVVLLAVTRPGLSLSHHLMECVPGLLVGSITIDRSDEGRAPQARLHLASAPALRDCRVLLFDPVVQSGSSADAALQLVSQLGAHDISLLSFSVTSQGLLRLQSANHGLNVWATHVDSDWDAKRSPASGLGDLAARLYA